jgi:hypothetical protein
MMNRTEKGRQARDYFIECERWAKNPAPALPGNYLEGTHGGSGGAAGAGRQSVEEQAPKIAALERIKASKKSLTITDAAKVLGVKRDELTKPAQGGLDLPAEQVMGGAQRPDSRRAHGIKEAHYTDDDGDETARSYCHLTSRGLARFARILGMDQDGQFHLSA